MNIKKAILVFSTRGGLYPFYSLWFKYTSTNMSAVPNSFSLILKVSTNVTNKEKYREVPTSSMYFFQILYFISLISQFL